MRGPPHKIHNFFFLISKHKIHNIDQPKTKHPHYTRKTIHKGKGCLRIDKSSQSQTQFLSLLSITFEQQTKNHLSWIILSEMLLKAMDKGSTQGGIEVK